MSFGQRLRELRRQKGLTLRSLASAAGVDFTYLSKIENGRVPYTPAPDTIRALAKALGADALELLELANKVPPELEGLSTNAEARIFLRRAQTIVSPDDWQALLEFLERRQRERTRGGSEGEG